LLAYYAARAREYDRVYAKPERQADLRAIERWLPPLFAGARVLEVACGTGYWTQFIAPVAQQTLAIDAAAETLAVARARVPTATVEFVVGDAYALPARAARFDAALAGFWFSHVPKSRRVEFLGGLHAALRPGARVVLLDNRYVEGSSTPISGHNADGNTFQMRPLAGGAQHRVLKNFPAADELRALVAGIGTDTDVVMWPHYWALSYRVAVGSEPRNPSTVG
jgi:demethylmenaquinone methyltransferase/2-methoxy-6-polyprenyl-1,4-benzoquinol methylase